MAHRGTGKEKIAASVYSVGCRGFAERNLSLFPVPCSPFPVLWLAFCFWGVYNEIYNIMQGE
jgi:hypothetical protein